MGELMAFHLPVVETKDIKSATFKHVRTGPATNPQGSPFLLYQCKHLVGLAQMKVYC